MIRDPLGRRYIASWQAFSDRKDAEIYHTNFQLCAKNIEFNKFTQMRFTSAKSNLNGYLSKTAVLIPTKLWDTFSDTLNVSECTCPKHVQTLTTCPRMCPVGRTRLNMSRLRMDTLNVSRNMSNNMSSTTREFRDMLKHVHIFVWTCSNVSHRPDTFKHVQNMSDVTSVQKCFKKIYFNTNS